MANTEGLQQLPESPVITNARKDNRKTVDEARALAGSRIPNGVILLSGIPQQIEKRYYIKPGDISPFSGMRVVIEN